MIRSGLKKYDKTRLSAFLTAVLIFAVTVCLAGCGREETPPEPTYGQPTEVPEGCVSENAQINLIGLTPDGSGTEYLTDKDRSTVFAFYPEDGEEGDIIIDLGAVFRISRIDVYPASDGIYFGRFFPRGFDVSVSCDGNVFEKVCRYSNVDAPDCVPVLEFTPTDARYLKLTVNAFASADGKKTSEIAGIDVVTPFGEYAYPE